MSVDGIDFEFFDLPMTKDLLKIKQTDSTEDAYLRGTLGLKAERWVKNNLIPFADSFPLAIEDQESAISASCNHAASKYKKANNNFDAAKSFMEDAKEDIESLIRVLKSRPTERTDLVVVSSDYKSEPLRARERFFD